MNGSLVSVIVPCYNYGHLLHEALDSLIAQTYQNWECIIVDDGSTDNSKAVAESYVSIDSRFKYIYQENKGLSSARNTGLKIAKGNYLQLLDADDILPAEKIRCHVTVLDQQKDLDLVYGTIYLFERHLSALPAATQFVMTNPMSGTRDDVMKSLIEDNMFLVHCALFKANIIVDVGYFNEKMITCEDWNFWFRCAVHGKRFLFLDNQNSKVYIRSHGANMSRNRRNMWIGRIHFRKEAAIILNREKGYTLAKKRNLQLLRVVDTRFSLAYGNVFSGLVGTLRIIYKDGDFFGTVYDSLYWIKERLLGRV